MDDARISQRELDAAPRIYIKLQPRLRNLRWETELAKESASAVSYSALMPETRDGFNPEAWAALLTSIANLLWPILILVIVILFRKQIGQFLGRLKHLKIFGQEVSLEEKVDELADIVPEKSNSAMSQSVESESTSGSLVPEVQDTNSFLIEEDGTAPQAASPQTEDIQRSEPPTTEPDIRFVRLQRRANRLAIVAPPSAILLLAGELERSVRELCASLGLDAEAASFRPLASQLQPYAPQWIVEGLGIFWDIRGRVVHGMGDQSSESVRAEVFRAVELGIKLLRGVEEIPREKHIVKFSNLEVYSNIECTKQIPDVRGLIIENVHSKTGVSSTVILPTTRLSYKPGDQVGWKFSFRLVWGDAWYRDPNSGEVRLAWNSAAEFVGDTIEEILAQHHDR